MKKTLLTSLSITSSVFYLFAAPTVNYSPVVNLIGVVQKILDRLVPLLVSLAVIGLFWFILQFTWKGADNPEERTKAKVGVFWSLIAIFMMVAIWGIIAFISRSLGVGLGGEMQQFKLPGQI